MISVRSESRSSSGMRCEGEIERNLNLDLHLTIGLSGSVERTKADGHLKRNLLIESFIRQLLTPH
jgi:hypothetical protein